MVRSGPVPWESRSSRTAGGCEPGRAPWSDRQLVTTLVAAGLEDGATRAGAHARPEAVGLGPLPLIWLISTLHENLFSKQLESDATVLLEGAPGATADKSTPPREVFWRELWKACMVANLAVIAVVLGRDCACG